MLLNASYMHVYVVDSVIIIIHIAASICFAHRLVLERGGGWTDLFRILEKQIVFLFSL